MRKPIDLSRPGIRTLTRNLTKYYGYYTGGFISFVILLAIAEQMGLPNVWIGYIFMAATFGLYALIGILSRTADISEYYVAGRRVPAVFNGMATAADWMSAASFIGMAGILVCSLLGGMEAIMWTQVAQYVILIIAYLVPVVMLSQRITEVPLPQFMYGQVLEQVSERERAIFQDPKQLEAQALYQ